MYLVYQPEGSDEPQRFKYQPTKLMSAERERLEKLTGRDFSDFTKAVLSGNSLCRRALLFVFLKREHPTTRFDDVDFAWDELTLEHSRAELEEIRARAAEDAPADQRAAVLAALDAEIADAYEEPEGKVLPPIAG
ncbi:hypothetical protein [Kitasatospora purpeofusca]|uniref:hypothetical protein n=1 Tax=Kitasatospora purpeofusca TaxID=67352 RepID=UPI00225183E9|nr:hypothetical protein [Kitasatospora purpeofusca]MCX4752890.1 hypothetical protein [Kitasatospora purpeofusca]WSR32434.1 hypothetical protein OG715_16460 [Kitasatospora purpeofusca]WSR40521.1 hypothetical protein OG196_16240 [Kitasatospora purpeofusca]